MKENKNLEKLREKQNEVFTSIAEILGGISSPTRIQLIHFLSQGPLTVDILAKKIDQTVANTSMHLRKMLALKIVTVSTVGKHRLYSLHPAAFVFWEACQDFAQEVDTGATLKVEEVFEEMDWSQDIKETIKLAKSKEITLLDARPKEEVSEELLKVHVLNIPSSELDENLALLNKKKPVVVFCRGRLCALSAYVVSELRKNGYKAYRLNESWYSLKNNI